MRANENLANSMEVRGCRQHLNFIMFTNLTINRAQKSFNSISILTSIKITNVGSSYFADWSGFNSHSINSARNQLESNLNQSFPEQSVV